jgi:hypothetical protein
MPTGLENLDLRVTVDYAQERQNRKGPFVFATDGTQVDAGTKVNCIIDPVTLSVFGTPLPMTNEWKSGTGASNSATPYYRFQKSDFTFTSAGGANDWLDIDYYANGDAYIISGSAVTARQQAPIQLTSGVSRNEPLFFSFSKLQKKNTDTAPLLKLFWVDDDNINNNTQLHFNSDGSCTVFRGYQTLSGSIQVTNSSTLLLGTNTRFLTELVIGSDIYDSYGRFLGTVIGTTTDISATLGANATYDYQGIYSDKIVPLKVQNYSRTESNYSQGRPISTIANPNDQFNDVYIVPMRGKELLVMTSYGLNFSHSFSNLNQPDPPVNINYYYQGIGNTSIPVVNTNISSTPVILPNGDFSIVISQGKIAFQLAKLYFLSNWSIESQVISLPVPPPSYSQPLTGSIMASQGSTAIGGTSTFVGGPSTLFTSELSAGDRISAFDSVNLNHYVVGTVNTIVDDTNLYLFDNSNYQTTSQYYKDTPLTGLFSFGIGSTVVTGSGTAFSTELSKFDLLYNNNNVLIGRVNDIISNTSLYLDTASSIAGTNQTPIWKNLNVYKSYINNFQAEIFGQSYPVSYDNALQLTGQIITSTGSTSNVFNNENQDFKIKIKQENLTSIGSTAATDYGTALYSIDQIYNLENEYTSNSAVDITSALESLSISRSENGDLSLSLDARHKMLSDLGVIKPEILSNRSIKVELVPRVKQLNGTITIDGSTTVTGVGTSFISDFSVGDSVYKLDGSLIGIATTITNNTNLSLVVNNIPGIEYNIDYTNEPNYEPICIFDGYLDSPDITYIQGINYDEYALLSFNAIDKKQRLNASYFNVAPNFDSLNLPTIIQQSILLAGQGQNNINEPNLSVSGSIFQYLVPLNRNNSQGQYNFVLNLGDTSGGFIEKIRSDFAQNFTFLNRGGWTVNQESQNGWNFSNSFLMQDLDKVPPTSPPVILYLNEETALANGGIPIYENYKRTIKNLQKTYETPEANRIIITGLDKTDGARIEFLKDDFESQNPLLAPALRPDNWLGDVYPFVMINDKLNSYSDVQQTGNQFFAKLSPGRELISFETDFLTYFNSQTKFTNNFNLPLGTLTLNATSSVLGVSTAFTTDLEIGDTLYTDLGVVIGIVQSITDDNNLILISATNITGSGIFFNTSTYYLNQYTYLDIGNIISLSDLEDNITNYMIIDFNVDFVREYINPEYSTIIPRNAKYRAKKIEIPASIPPEFIFDNNAIPRIDNWIVTSGYDLTYQILAISEDNYKTIVYSLQNAPVGMVINSSTGVITWTPGVGDENEVYNDIEVIAFDGTDSTSYYFNVRVYPTL